MRQDKKKWYEKESCFDTELENNVAAVQNHNGAQQVSSKRHGETLPKHPLKRCTYNGTQVGLSAMNNCAQIYLSTEKNLALA